MPTISGRGNLLNSKFRLMARESFIRLEGYKSTSHTFFNFKGNEIRAESTISTLIQPQHLRKNRFIWHSLEKAIKIKTSRILVFQPKDHGRITIRFLPG